MGYVGVDVEDALTLLSIPRYEFGRPAANQLQAAPDPLRTFALGSAIGALHAPDANLALWEAKRSFDDLIGTGK